MRMSLKNYNRLRWFLLILVISSTIAFGVMSALIEDAFYPLLIPMFLGLLAQMHIPKIKIKQEKKENS